MHPSVLPCVRVSCPASIKQVYKGNCYKNREAWLLFHQQDEIRPSLLKKKKSNKTSFHFAEIPKLLDEINHNCQPMTPASRKATIKMIVWVSLDVIFTSMSHHACPRPQQKHQRRRCSEETPALPCSCLQVAALPHHRLPLAFSSPVNAGWSLCAACHINVCFVNVIHKSFHGNRNGNYCGSKDDYSLTAASLNSHTLTGLLLETGEVLGLPATPVCLMCSISNVNVSTTWVSSAKTRRAGCGVVRGCGAGCFWFVSSTSCITQYFVSDCSATVSFSPTWPVAAASSHHLL